MLVALRNLWLRAGVGVTGSGPDGGRGFGWAGSDGSWASVARGFVLRRARFVLGASAAVHWPLGAGSWVRSLRSALGGS